MTATFLSFAATIEEALRASLFTLSHALGVLIAAGWPCKECFDLVVIGVQLQDT
jgi:hypothetical protein